MDHLSSSSFKDMIIRLKGKDMEIIKLRERDVALVFGEHKMEVYLPNNDENVTDMAMDAVAISVLIDEEDAELRTILDRKIKEIKDEIGVESCEAEED